MPKVKKIVCLTGGLGNQLFQLALAASFPSDFDIQLETKLGSPKTNSDGLPLIYDYKLPENIHLLDSGTPSFIELKIYRWLLTGGISKRLHLRLKLLEDIERRFAEFLLSRYLKQKIKLHVPHNVGFEKFELFNNKMQVMIGYFQSESYFSSDAKRYLADLTPIFQSEELSEYRELALRESPIVIHVRLGDYNAEEKFGIPTPDYYNYSVEKLKLNGVKGGIWVFSNDLPNAKLLLDLPMFGDVRWMPEISNSSSQTLEAMRLGSAFVIGNSTYSWWGAYLSRNRQSPKIAPIPWFQSKGDPCYVVPLNWDRVNAWERNE